MRIGQDLVSEPLVLRRHRLRHLPELAVDEALLRTRYASGCSMSRCSAHCCREGALIGSEERDRILDHADLVRSCMDKTQEPDAAKWFSEEIEDPDFPTGRAVGTEVRDGACVFLDDASLCVLQKAEAQVGPLKPFFCRAYPICIEYGVLTVDDVHCPNEHGCCGPAADGSLTILDICEYELSFVLGAEGLRELQDLAQPEPPAATPRKA